MEWVKVRDEYRSYDGCAGLKVFKDEMTNSWGASVFISGDRYGEANACGLRDEAHAKSVAEALAGLLR